MALSPQKSCFKYNESEDHDPQKARQKYKQIISKAVKNSEWFGFSDLYMYQGFWFAPTFLKGTMIAQEQFSPQPNDIILCSYPRTGTTWLKSLCFAIINRNNSNIDFTSSLHSVMPHKCVPFLEVEIFQQKSIRFYPKIPLVATHIPYNSLPNSVTDSNCKLVYICGDPKDVLVSMWHFIGNIKCNEKETNFPLEKGFELFCRGISLHGPYWDHALGYWRASLKWPERILFIKYEDLKERTSSYVKRMAEFMGCPFSFGEEREGVVEKIIEMCDFHNLKDMEVNRKGEYVIFESVVVQNERFFRKGEVGDWKNYLTADMQERLDSIVNSKLQGSGLSLC